MLDAPYFLKYDFKCLCVVKVLSGRLDLSQQRFPITNPEKNDEAKPA